MNEYNHNHIDLLKLDIEGAEINVLNKMCIKCNKKQINTIQIIFNYLLEFHQPQKAADYSHFH